MARRRRALAALGDGQGAAAEISPKSTAPIAFAAGEAAQAAAEEMARLRASFATLAAAEAEGRVLADVPLEAVETGFIARDRMPSADPDDAFRALKASLAESGQRVPVDLVALGQGRYGLIAGWRRVQALKDLHWETGDPRFATVRALVRSETDALAVDRAEAFRAMVEENEIRADLSHYERGRICALAAEAGAFEDAEAALAALFSAVSAPKRSKIRSFLLVHRELGDLLAFPEHIPERLGLDLAKALKWGRGEALRAALAGQAPKWRGPDDEQTALRAALASKPAPTEESPITTGRGSGRTGSRRSADPTKTDVIVLRDGLTLERRSFAGHTDLRLSGPALDEATIQAALDAIATRLSE